MPDSPPSPTDYLIGIDESGTGAWCGPFTIVGVIVFEPHFELEDLWREGVINDSKRMTDKQRRTSIGLIADAILSSYLYAATVDQIRTLGQKKAWRIGVLDVIDNCLRQLPPDATVSIVIDGSFDKVVAAQYPEARFIKRADSSVAAVAAASVIAKTIRNDLMIELSKKYPEFGFERNAGYGTAEHIARLRQHGVTPDHRPIKAIPKLTTQTYTP